MKVATIQGANKKHVIECDQPALCKEHLEPEIPNAIVGIAYGVVFSVIIFYIGLAVWHIIQ